MFFFYDRLISLAVAAVLLPAAFARRLLGRASAAEIRDRLGRGGTPRRDARLRIVLHAVSAGEMAAAGAIADALADVVPDAALHLTTGNRDGFAAAERLRARRPAVESVAFLPWDRSRAVARWLARVDPDAVAVVETEIWPALFLACARAGIPLVVVNGRVPDRDFPRYRAARAFFRRVLAAARRIVPQSAEDARRFVAIGADPDRVARPANVKFDAAATDGGEVPPRRTFPAVVAGSTHPPEERLLLAALLALRPEFPDVPLVLAPRHVHRAAAIVRSGRRSGLRAAPASEAPTDSDVVVLDAIGRLRETYAEGDVAIVGGSFSRRGGHTPLEAAARGCAIVFGPNPGSFRTLAAELHAAGAAVAGGRDTLVDAIGALLRDEARRREMGRRARAFAEAGRGAARRCAEEIAAAVRDRRGGRALSGSGIPAASPPRGSAGRGT